MTRMIRAATAAALLTSGLCSVGCVSTGTSAGCGSTGTSGEATCGDRYRNAVDPCYPERYNHAARQAVIAPFAQQVHNGHVLNQTIFNYYFEFGTDKLTPAGMEKLDSIARTRPAPDPRLYIQTTRDMPPGEPEKLAQVRLDLDVRRAAAIQRYMSGQPAFAPVSYEIFVHDPAVPGIIAEFPAGAYRGSARGYVGGVTGGGGGVGAVSTGGGGGNLTTAPPVTGGGTGTRP